jgi:hypothetical protein
MLRFTSLRALSFGILVVLAIPRPVWGQAELWLSPVLGELMLRADYRATYYFDEKVKGQATDLGLTQHRVSLSVPIWQSSRDEWALSASVRLQDFDTRAVLPDTGQRFPTELWDVRIGPTYRHRFENGWIAGANVTVGSASDEPFASEDEIVVRAVGFLRVPHGERNAWFFTLNYTNYSEVLGGIPVPGVSYVYSPSDRFTAIIGFPFASLQASPAEKLTFELSYLPLRTVRVRANYQLFRPLRLYAGFDWDNEFHLLADRGDKDDRLFYYEKRFTGGARMDLRHLTLELSGGYAFDRFYFEGERYADRHENRLDIEAGPFVAARVGVRF